MVEIAPLTSLTIDTMIKARVTAFNSNGWGEPSEPNISGQVVHTVPLQMDPVTIDPITDVTNLEVTVHWVPLAGIYTGGSAVDVDEYDLEWDSGNAGTWTSLATVQASETSYTKTSLTGGVIYGFRIRAVNEYGSSAVLSEATYILTA